MALFWAAMSLARYWAEEFVWTGPDEGYCRSIAWKERYLPQLHPPCVVDRLFDYTTEIKVPGIVLIGIGTIAAGGVLVCAELRWGSFPREGFRSR